MKSVDLQTEQAKFTFNCSTQTQIVVKYDQTTQFEGNDSTQQDFGKQVQELQG